VVTSAHRRRGDRTASSAKHVRPQRPRMALIAAVDRLFRLWGPPYAGQMGSGRPRRLGEFHRLHWFGETWKVTLNSGHRSDRHIRIDCQCIVRVPPSSSIHCLV
jgi:hypothetical protein